MHARRWEQLKRNIHTASHRREQYHNCLLVAAAVARAHCTCGCVACTGITCSCVASAPVSTCLLTSGAMISASSSELRHTSLLRPLPQPPLPAPRPQAPPRPQLALRLRFTPTTFRFAAACVPLKFFLGGTSLCSLHRGQHCRADVCMDWLQPSCSERSGAKCSIPHELHTDMG
jgi:hypothetical protein